MKKSELIAKLQAMDGDPDLWIVDDMGTGVESPSLFDFEVKQQSQHEIYLLFELPCKNVVVADEEYSQRATETTTCGWCRGSGMETISRFCRCCGGSGVTEKEV